MNPRELNGLNGDEDITAEQLEAMQYFSDSSDDDDPVAAERLGIVRKKKKVKART